MYASFGRRLGAQILDGLFFSFPVSIIFGIFMGFEDAARNIADWATYVYMIALPVLWQGRTIGKSMVRIRIRKLDDSEPGWGTMLLRHGLCYLIYAFTFGIGLLVSIILVLARPDNRSLHDLIAGTVVVRDGDRLY